MGKTRIKQQIISKNFPTVDSTFGDGFTVLPTFVPTDTLEQPQEHQRDSEGNY